MHYFHNIVSCCAEPNGPDASEHPKSDQTTARGSRTARLTPGKVGERVLVMCDATTFTCAGRGRALPLSSCETRLIIYKDLMKSNAIAERNYEIAAARAAGIPNAQVAKRFDVTSAHASQMAIQNAWLVDRRQGRPLPSGLTTRAAVLIEDELGIWPTDADKDHVMQRASEIFRSVGGRRSIMADIGSWLGI